MMMMRMMIYDHHGINLLTICYEKFEERTDNALKVFDLKNLFKHYLSSGSARGGLVDSTI